MDLTPIFLQVLKSFWWLMPLAILIAYLKSPRFKGKSGEAMVRFVAKFHLPADTYHLLNDVTLPTVGGTTQIDHLIVSRFGIFVIETKNMKGWIFGSEHQPHWTQNIYEQTHKFQNPLRQNYKHIKCVEALLGVSSDVVHSVVIFIGESTFRTEMPPNVFKGGQYALFIKSFSKSVFTEEEVAIFIARIDAARLKRGWKTDQKHIDHVKHRNSPKPDHACPRCGNEMVLRVSRKGKNVGKKFWGCSAFPKCRFVRSV